MDAIEFFKHNKTEFGITYVRGDMSLWSEDDMILVAILSKTTTSKSFRKELRLFAKENAKVGLRTHEEYNNLAMALGRMSVEKDQLEQILRPRKKITLQLVN